MLKIAICNFYCLKKIAPVPILDGVIVGQNFPFHPQLVSRNRRRRLNADPANHPQDIEIDQAVAEVPACGVEVIAVLAITERDFSGVKMVPGAGLEPARPIGQRILSPLRLPFRHPGTGISPNYSCETVKIYRPRMKTSHFSKRFPCKFFLCHTLLAT